MPYRAAKPKHITFSESLARLIRTKRNFAVRPFFFDKDRWAKQRISSQIPERQPEEERDKKMIRDETEGVKGLKFPAEEMAKIIRGWIAQDQ